MSEVKQKTQLSLGELLQRARSHKKMSREQVARQLHVQPQVLALFEHNDFNKLNVPEHFILQHLTDYADLVDLDASAVIDIYHQGGVINLAPVTNQVDEPVEVENKLVVQQETSSSVTSSPRAKAQESRPNTLLTSKKKVKKELSRMTAEVAPVELPEAPSLSATPELKEKPSTVKKQDKQQEAKSGISAVCDEDTAFTAPSLKSETRRKKPIKKSHRLLRWSYNLIVLALIIAAAFFWYRSQIGQLKLVDSTATQQNGQKLTPFAEPSAAEQQAAEKMKLEQHIQSNEAMAAQYKILKVPPQSQETGQS